MSIPKLLLPTLAVGGLYSQTVLANQAPTAFQVSGSFVNSSGEAQTTSSNRIRALWANSNAIESAQLSLQLQTRQSQVQVGDLAVYHLHLQNNTTQDTQTLSLRLALPQGLALVDNRLQLNNASLAPDKSSQSWYLPPLAAGASHTISYIVRVTAKAKDLELIQQAQVLAQLPDQTVLKSPLIQNKLTLKDKGLLSSQGLILGRVSFAKDCSAEALPIGGTKIFLEDGRYAITDAQGDFSFQVVKSGVHTIKLDNQSLPQGTQPLVTDNRQLEDGSSFILDVFPGASRRVDFQIACPSKQVDATLKAVKHLNKQLQDHDVYAQGERAKQSEPLLASQSQLLNNTSAKPSRSTKVKRPVVQRLFTSLTPQQAQAYTWLWPTTKIVDDGHLILVIPATETATLYVNGQAISEAQVGEQMIDSSKNIQLLSWYGLALQPGDNHLELRNQANRVLTQKTLRSPKPPAQILIQPAKTELAADGGISNLPITIQVLDEDAQPTQGDYFLTIHASDGQWLEPDIQNKVDGHQVRISNGQGTIHLRSSNQTGKVRLNVKLEQLSDKVQISQVAPQRPLIATGFLNIQAHQGGRQAKQGRVFMKGSLKGGLYLTLAYASDKTPDDYPLYSDEDPARDYYPVMGDASIHGQEAKSHNKLYVKVEKGVNSLMYGDYAVDKDSGSLSENLARTPRHITGLASHTSLGNTDIELFAAQQAHSHRVEWIAGNGTSLNYRLSRGDILSGSEVIELITEDRTNPSLTINTYSLVPLTDYTLNPVTGDLQFTRVIPSFDINGNPMFIRASYEQTDTAKQDKHWVAGARVKQQLTDDLSGQLNYSRDDDPTEGSQTAGVALDYSPSKKTNINAGYAQHEDFASAQQGQAYTLQAQHEWDDKSSTQFLYAHADEHFNNAPSGLVAGTERTQLRHTEVISPDTQVMLEGMANSASKTQASNQAITGKMQTRVDNWQVSAGARHIQHEQANQTREHNTVLAGAQRSFKVAERPLRVRAEYEQDIQQHDFNKTTLDAEVALTKDTSVYGRYENGNDILGLQGLDDTQRRETFKLGAKTKANKNLELYSEYRSDMLADAAQADAEVATGLRGRYSLEKNLELQPNIEVIKAPSHSAVEDAVATSLSLNDTRNTDQQRYLKLETRKSENREFYGAKASYVAKLDEDWTGLVRDEISVDKAAEGELKRHRFILGAAHRPQADDVQLNSQYLYQLKQDKQSQQALDSTTHIVSTHQNFVTESGTEVYGRLAAKHQQQRIGTDNQQSVIAMADAGINFDLNEKLAADIHAGVLSTDDGAKQYAYGAGVKLAVAENWRLGVGYNFSGFNNDDLDSNNSNREGAYANLQAKIGEDMFKAIQPEIASADDTRWQYLDTPSPSQFN